MMYRTYLKAAIGVLLAVVSLVSDGKTQARRGKSDELCPDQKIYTGEYTNQFYRFSIVIPAGLKGYWNSDRCSKTNEGCVCGTDHGRIIPLADDAQIEAYAIYEMVSEWTVNDSEKAEIADLKKREGVKQVKVLSSKGIRLGGVKARRFVVQFIEKGNQVISDRVVVQHKKFVTEREKVEYELSLHTLANRYRKDRRKFEKVIASWRFSPRIE